MLAGVLNDVQRLIMYINPAVFCKHVVDTLLGEGSTLEFPIGTPVLKTVST